MDRADAPDGPDQLAALEAHGARLEMMSGETSAVDGPVCPPHWVTNTTWQETGDTEVIDAGLGDGSTVEVPVAVQVKTCQACGASVALDYDPALDPANPAYTGS